MVCWHPKGEVLVTCSYDDSIKVWVEDDGEWECAQTLAGPGLGHSSTVWGVAFDASGQRMVSCSDDQTLKIWACHFDNPGRLHVCCNVPQLVGTYTSHAGPSVAQDLICNTWDASAFNARCHGLCCV